MTPQCTWPRCRSTDIELRWMGKDLCLHHWLELCRLDMTEQEIRRKLGLEPATDPGLLGTGTQ